MEKEGTLIVVSGSSGAGKTSIVLGSIAQSGIGERIVTCTTRAPRQGEVDGKDYYFLSRDAFMQKLNAGEFVEHAEVYGNYYGTLALHVAEARKKHAVAMLITDIQGARAVLCRYQEAWGIFISTSREDLAERLRLRGESPENIATRLAQFETELAQTNIFNHCIQNKSGQLPESIREFLHYTERYCRVDELTALHNPPDATD